MLGVLVLWFLFCLLVCLGSVFGWLFFDGLLFLLGICVGLMVCVGFRVLAGLVLVCRFLFLGFGFLVVVV